MIFIVTREAREPNDRDREEFNRLHVKERPCINEIVGVHGYWEH